jgi:hypothetical protein
VKFRKLINAFNGGEISRRMEGRADLDGIYDKAFVLMFNFVPAVEGPAMKRPGFRYITAADSTAEWVSRFVFNNTQAYVLEWGDGKVRFFTNGGRIETAPGVAYELAVPYTAEEAPRLSIKQSFDRLYIAHPNHAPAMITRIAASEFTYGEIPLKDGPFQDWNTDESKTLTWTGTGTVGGTATLTVAAGTPFLDGHVGSYVIFEVKGFKGIKAWEPMTATAANTSNPGALHVGTKVRSDGKVYTAESVPYEYTGTIEPTHNDGAEWDGIGDKLHDGTGDRTGVLWRYSYDRYGVGKITAIGAAGAEATITVTRSLPELDDPTFRWALPSFSAADGWPQLVDVWGQRLILWHGVDIAGSVTGDYFNMAPLDKSGIFAPDMAFRRRLDVADPPLWTHADKDYVIAGTASGELVVGQINRAAGLSSDNIRADPQSSYGSSQAWPIAIGTALLFAQRGGRKIREAQFDYSQDRFVGPNINVYARHITKSGIAWLAYQQEPEEILWAGRNDGVLIAHPHNPENQVKGFARVALASGSAVSGVSIPSEDGSTDELWILATLGSEKGILQLAEWWDEDAGTDRADAFFVDWGVSYSGAPLGTFTSGLSHLEGQTVRVLADGVEYNGLTVTGGSISLPNGKTASKVHIGLGYQARIKLLRPEPRGIPSAQGLRKRLLRVLARLIDTASLLLVNQHGDQDRMFDRPTATPMGSPPPFLNGDTDNVSAGDGSSFDAAGELLNDDASPCLISMLVPTYELEELDR